MIHKYNIYIPQWTLEVLAKGNPPTLIGRLAEDSKYADPDDMLVAEIEIDFTDIMDAGPAAASAYLQKERNAMIARHVEELHNMDKKIAEVRALPHHP